MASQLSERNVFHHNLESVLNIRRQEDIFYEIKTNSPTKPSVDFSSLDVLSLASTGIMRDAFLEELARRPTFALSECGSRLLINNLYTDSIESRIAAFHGAEKALLFHSGWDANVSIFSTIPRPGDVLVYDELIHASMHEGMKLSATPHKVGFQHNDIESLREALLTVRNTHEQIRNSERCVLICVESLYSMDGDVAPLKQFVGVANEVFPSGNAQFIVDEAHTTGTVGPRGSGLVRELDLQNHIAIRTHTYGKAMASCGGGNGVVYSMLVNLASVIIYSAAPQFPFVAAITAAYNLLESGRTHVFQQSLQQRIRHFFEAMTAHPAWDDAVDDGILAIPPAEEWQEARFLTHIVPVITRQRYVKQLAEHLRREGLHVHAIEYPVVPKGRSRVRIVIHAANSEVDLEKLAQVIGDWAWKIMDIERGTESNWLAR